jgi:hypothetical protein
VITWCLPMLFFSFVFSLPFPCLLVIYAAGLRPLCQRQPETSHRRKEGPRTADEDRIACRRPRWAKGALWRAQPAGARLHSTIHPLGGSLGIGGSARRRCMPLRSWGRTRMRLRAIACACAWACVCRPFAGDARHPPLLKPHLRRSQSRHFYSAQTAAHCAHSRRFHSCRLYSCRLYSGRRRSRSRRPATAPAAAAPKAAARAAPRAPAKAAPRAAGSSTSAWARH